MRALWSRWLAVAAGIVFALGLSFIVVAEPMRRVFEELLYVSTTGWRLGEAAASYTLFMQGVLGATLMGWGLMMLLAALGPFKNEDPSAWNMIAISLGVWYVADTAFSIWSGYTPNAILNTILLALFIVPLAATFGHFQKLKARAKQG
jgi:hypothetical protein